jgi:hypothetical protein
MAEERVAAVWGYNEGGEHRWPAALAIIAAVLLYISLPSRFITGPIWLLPVLQGALLISLFLSSPRRHAKEQPWERLLSILLIAIINVYNLSALAILITILIHPGHVLGGDQILTSAVQIWLTNVIVFALWYWELDRGGPAERSKKEQLYPDFLFPQMTTADVSPRHWTPRFIDYFYVSFTNATAFSPTDTLPLTSWAKLLMLIQAFASLLIVALVAARAVNILS